MKKLTFAAVAAATIALTTPVSAQNSGCWPDRPTMIAELAGEKYQEQQILAGTSKKYAPRGVTGIEFWANAATGTYTYVFAYRNGTYCVGDEGIGLSFGPFDEEKVEPEGDPD